ncbi:hypothetical protein OSCT_0509 [Oscillochloris trichoides DG-6]|uniref:Uncharacterized protein n=1 Tax=Oscillochloris trichoides DG-6 TaxID=765420 RepID=E1IB08_9CHLR|nr:hypothetical protein [Oscillochloris trichoides]EFO81654.1 hypothetical protein OSCT_0509 [Oscillochloris trichoides DG-6]
MNRNWNWQGWLAIAIACLALVISLSDRVGWRDPRQMMMGTAPNQMMMQPGPGHMMDRNNTPPQMMPGWNDQNAMPHHMMGQRGGWGAFGILGGVLGGLLDLAKLAGLGLLAWLLWRLFTQRQAAPLTPAGHDPRVE